jgi:hypothetical protein
LLAYVAAIEGLGSKIVELKKCSCCDECDAITGSARRFRQALWLVLTKAESKALDSLYGQRSKTAHEGSLHAGEIGFGSWGRPQMFGSQDKSSDFRYRQLWSLRAASAKLIEHFTENN